MSFFFNDTATTEIYTLSLHDALPICVRDGEGARACRAPAGRLRAVRDQRGVRGPGAELPARLGLRRLRARRARSEEHTSELQSLAYLVCRLLLEKKIPTSPRILPDPV